MKISIRQKKTVNRCLFCYLVNIYSSFYILYENTEIFMTEQELIQENEKLNARLKKAIDVFKEQKENITRLTEERDSAKQEITRLDTRVQELEAKVAESSENDSKFFDLLNEIEVIKEQAKGLEADKASLEESLTHSENVRQQALNEGKKLKTYLDEAQEEINGLTDANSSLEKTVYEKNETIENLTNALDKVNKTLNQERKEHQEFMNRLIDTEYELHKMLNAAGA